MAVRPDLYWQWAEATHYACFEPMPANWWVALLVECVESRNPGNLHTWLKQTDAKHPYGKGFVAKLYRTADRRFCTAWVARDCIASLPQATVKRFQLGLPRMPGKPDDFTPMADDFLPYGVHEPSLHPAAQKALLALIDDNINVNHPCFLDASGNSRFEVFWNQNTNDAKAPTRPAFGYKLGARGQNPANHRVRASHGTHVASLAGGNVTPQHRLRHSHAQIACTSQFDAASTTALAGVVLPERTVQDTSGGALAANVFDALSFLCHADNTPAETHIVANLSFGTMAGPHDGTALLDAAIEEVNRLRQGKLTLVIPAGNSFEAQCHARFSVEPNLPANVVWRVLPDDRTPSFVEIWLPKKSTLKVSLKSPDGKCHLLSTASSGNLVYPQGGALAGSAATAGIFRSDNPANGDKGQLVLLAVHPTRADKPVPTARHGDWTITLENDTNAAVPVNMWVERDNASFGRRTLGRQSFLIDPIAGLSAPRKQPRKAMLDKASRVSGFGSLNGIASNGFNVVVGGYDLTTLQPLAQSAAGSLRSKVRNPDGTAAANESPQLPGLPGAAHCGSGSVRLGGTSVAAPVVSRFFVNRLQAGHPVGPRPGPATDEIEGAGRMPF